MISSGTLAAAVPPERVADAKSSLTKMGLLFADVGRVTEGAGVSLLGEGEPVHYREIRCEEDELARMWSLYPRKE